MKNLFNKLKNFRKPERTRQMAHPSENEAFLKLASFQLKELAKKGLSIPVFTL